MPVKQLGWPLRIPWNGTAIAAVLLLLAGCATTAPSSGLTSGDRALLDKTVQLALENNRTGEGSNWHAAGSDHGGTVTPLHTYRGFGGANCRDFQQTVTVGGETDIAYGSACRNADGSWRIVEAPSPFHRRYAPDPFDYPDYWDDDWFYRHPYWPYRHFHRYP